MFRSVFVRKKRNRLVSDLSLLTSEFHQENNRSTFLAAVENQSFARVSINCCFIQIVFAVFSDIPCMQNIYSDNNKEVGQLISSQQRRALRVSIISLLLIRESIIVFFMFGLYKTYLNITSKKRPARFSSVRWKFMNAP